jgi:hypothetical protein
MSTTTVTLSNIQVQLTVEQLVTAVQELESEERAQIAKALAKMELDAELAQLITDLYSKPEVTDISDDDILAEVRAVRQQPS